MTDFERIKDMVLRISHEKWHIFHGENTSLRDPTESLRVTYWLEGLKQRTGLVSAYELEQHFEKESFARNSDGSIRHYRSKWSRYAKDRHTPIRKTLQRVEGLAPGSTRELKHPLWDVICISKPLEEHFFSRLELGVQEVLFETSYIGVSSFLKPVPITQRTLKKLERRSNLDVLACLIWLLRDASERSKIALAKKIARSLYNVLLLLCIELHERRVAVPLLRILIRDIFPLGLEQYHRMWMIDKDFIHASAFLNLLAYRGSQKTASLDWPRRVKIMCRLLDGKMGLDVMYAMAPQFSLTLEDQSIPVRVIKEHERNIRLREWGWDCILSGQREEFPPDELW